MDIILKSEMRESSPRLILAVAILAARYGCALTLTATAEHWLSPRIMNNIAQDSSWRPGVFADDHRNIGEFQLSGEWRIGLLLRSSLPLSSLHIPYMAFRGNRLKWRVTSRTGRGTQRNLTIFVHADDEADSHNTLLREAGFPPSREHKSALRNLDEALDGPPLGHHKTLIKCFGSWIGLSASANGNEGGRKLVEWLPGKHALILKKENLVHSNQLK
ncbi:hypothetical protein CCUS01_17445 [Colletotrichum cuscutae]|uniref:Uncharacterized protein n=1 Tax=Colletotrichum cuscutae TaxID=1209917 RepID=A0AAI9V4P6_9PEZI|nr:hypothetical protein CCUS01_17445 [Colletotrichum cuscutae]